MEQNTNQEQQTPTPKSGMSDFRKGLLWTAAPISLVGIISSMGISELIMGWIVAVGLWIVASITAIVLSIAGRRGLASGIFAGVGISFVVLGITCFANIGAASSVGM
jgi:hypothetical protein